MSDKIYIHVRGHNDVYARGVEIAGNYIPKQLPRIDGDNQDAQFDIKGVFATDSSVNLIDIPGVAEWAEQEAINPKGMSVHDGMARVHASDLKQLLAASSIRKESSVVVPEGWEIKQPDNATIIVSKAHIGGYVATNNSENIASSILFALASDLLATAPHLFGKAEQATKKHEPALTDGEIQEIWCSVFGETSTMYDFARAIEAKLK